MAFTEVIDLFFADFGDTATWNGNTAKVILDVSTEDILGGRVLSNEYSMTLPSIGFPGINRGAQVVLGASTYVVREVRFIDDGVVKELLVGKV
jgi:hypothetical protein